MVKLCIDTRCHGYGWDHMDLHNDYVNPKWQFFDIGDYITSSSEDVIKSEYLWYFGNYTIVNGVLFMININDGKRYLSKLKRVISDQYYPSEFDKIMKLFLYFERVYDLFPKRTKNRILARLRKLIRVEKKHLKSEIEGIPNGLSTKKIDLKGIISVNVSEVDIIDFDLNIAEWHDMYFTGE